MNKKIYHAHKRFRQGNRPICGIYAFLNGVFEGKHKCKVKRIVNCIWDMSIDCNAQPMQSSEKCEIFDAKTTSLVGEFFSSDRLKNFLNDKRDDVIPKLRFCDPRIIEYDVKSATLSHLCTNSKNNEDIFYLIPINTSWKGINKNNLHWICLKKRKGKYYIYNSAADWSGERKALYNCYGIKKLRIKDFLELEDLWKDMTNRCKGEPFNFTLWAKSKKYKGKYSRYYKYMLDEINNSDKTYESSFKNSDFRILEVTVTYKGQERRR